MTGRPRGHEEPVLECGLLGLGETRGMAGMPETRYAVRDGLHVAYQAMGEGPPDVVFIPEWSGHVSRMSGDTASGLIDGS
jgi:hypothetical protein